MFLRKEYSFQSKNEKESRGKETEVKFLEDMSLLIIPAVILFYLNFGGIGEGEFYAQTCMVERFGIALFNSVEFSISNPMPLRNSYVVPHPWTHFHLSLTEEYLTLLPCTL